MITLQNAESTLFTTLGLGSLVDVVRGTVTEELNGMYELVMDYPITGSHYADIQLRRIIYCKPNPYSDPQPFRIYHISKPINRIVTISAAHISYDLTGFPVNAFVGTSPKDTMSKLKSNATISHNFSFNSTVTTTGEVNVEGPRSTRSVLGNNVLSAYGGELEFDGFMVYHYEERGMDRGVSIRYGKNLTDINQEENISEMYTGVYPFWVGYEYDEETGEQGDKKIVILPEKIVPVPGTFSFDKVLPLDMSGDFQDPPTEEELRSKTLKYIDKNDLDSPTISIDVSFVQLSRSTEYSQYAVLEQVEIGDKLNIEFMEAQISATARCVKTVYNIVSDKYDSITLGEGKSNLASAISDGNKQVNEDLEKQKQFFDAEVGKIKIDLAVIDTALIGKADIEYLNANFAHITNGVIDNAVIGDATITTAKIQDAAIVTAKIQDAAITVAKIQDGFIDNLVVNQGKFESAHIGKLTAENIQAGTITSNEIATGTITAASGIIADGAIGNAQISNIDANKINAGEIDTSKIKIVGENGFLFIENNTLFVVDENRQIRCELGVVENGTNYGFIVRGADGTTILLDQNGVRNAGITDGAVDNRVVSENANISGKKLDINSVIRTINEDGSVKIQGTVVQVGETTLDIKLSEQTNLITSNTTQLETQQSQINANTNSISLKVDNQTYVSDKEAMTSAISKNTSSIDVLNGEIALKVDETFVNSSITEAENRTDTKIETATAAIKITTDAITQRVDANETTTTTIGNELDAVQIDVTNTKNQVAIIETDIDSITQRVDSAETNVTNISNDLNGVSAEVTETKNQVALIETELGTITQRVSNTESTTATLTDKIDNIKIGGKNLIPYTDLTTDVTAQYKVWGSNTILRYDKDPVLGGVKVHSQITLRDNSPTVDSGPFGLITPSVTEPLLTNVEYSLSFKSMSRGNTGYLDYIYLMSNEEGVGNVKINIGNITINPYAKEDVISVVKFTPTRDYPNASFLIARRDSITTADKFYAFGIWDIQVERGINTSWSPAPEDTVREITSTNSQIAEVITDLSGITQRVTNTESDVTSLNGEITEHETRLSSAESKITPTAIVNTVTGSSTYQNDLGAKASVSSVTSMQQDMDSFEFRVQSSGTGNLLKNGHREKFYTIAQAVQTTAFTLDDNIKTSLKGQQITIAFDAKGSYTNSTNASMFGVELRVNYSDGSTDWLNCSTSNTTIKPTLHGSIYRRWIKQGLTVKNVTISDLAVYTFARYCDGNIGITNALLQIGDSTGIYVPHKASLIDNLVTIDGNGLTINSSGSNITTTVNNSGFVVKRIDNSKELFKVSSGNLTMEGVLRTGTSGQRIEVSDSNYKVYDGSTDKAFFGFRNFENSYTVPKFYMGAYGFDMNSHNYFGITPYRGNTDNPQGSGAAYVDLSYRSITHLDWSNIKMYSDGNIRMAPIQNFEITTNFLNGSYSNQNERRLAMFTTSSVDGFNSNLQIGMVANHSNSYGLILADRFRDAGWDGAGGASSGSTWRTAVRVGTDSSNGKFFRPLTTEKNIQCGSGSYPWNKVYSANGVAYSEGVMYNPAMPQTLIEITPDTVLDNINITTATTLSGKSTTGLYIDVTNILNTPYAEVCMEEGATEESVYMNEGEMVKLLLMEVKNLKETVKLLKQL